MNSQSFNDTIALLRPQRVEVGYELDGYWFRIEGALKEVIFYDEEEPFSDTRVVIATEIDDFDLEINTMHFIRRLDVP